MTEAGARPSTRPGWRLADQRDGHRVGAHAVAGRASCGIGASDASVYTRRDRLAPNADERIERANVLPVLEEGCDAEWDAAVSAVHRLGLASIEKVRK